MHKHAQSTTQYKVAKVQPSCRQTVVGSKPRSEIYRTHLLGSRQICRKNSIGSRKLAGEMRSARALGPKFRLQDALGSN